MFLSFFLSLSLLCLYLFPHFIYVNRLLHILCIFKTHKQIIHLNHIETSSSLITCKFVIINIFNIWSIFTLKIMFYVILNICNSISCFHKLYKPLLNHYFMFFSVFLAIYLAHIYLSLKHAFLFPISLPIFILPQTLYLAQSVSLSLLPLSVFLSCANSLSSLCVGVSVRLKAHMYRKPSSVVQNPHRADQNTICTIC